MKYRKLGNTGLIVSEVALGTMQFGGQMNMGNLGQEDTTRMVKLALDRGINFIDTADVYSLGESEALVGNALRGVRQEIVLGLHTVVSRARRSRCNYIGDGSSEQTRRGAGVAILNQIDRSREGRIYVSLEIESALTGSVVSPRKGHLSR